MARRDTDRYRPVAVCAVDARVLGHRVVGPLLDSYMRLISVLYAGSVSVLVPDRLVVGPFSDPRVGTDPGNAGAVDVLVRRPRRKIGFVMARRFANRRITNQPTTPGPPGPPGPPACQVATMAKRCRRRWAWCTP